MNETTNANLFRNYGTHWMRGAGILVRVSIIAWVFAVTCFRFRNESNDLPKVVTKGWDVFLVLSFAGLGPWLISRFIREDLDRIEQQSRRVSEAVDRLVAGIPIDLTDHWTQRVTELLAAGKRPTAIRQIHDEAGLTWPAARAAIAEWETASAEWRLQTVVSRLLDRHATDDRTMDGKTARNQPGQT